MCRDRRAVRQNFPKIETKSSFNEAKHELTLLLGTNRPLWAGFGISVACQTSVEETITWNEYRGPVASAACEKRVGQQDGFVAQFGLLVNLVPLNADCRCEASNWSRSGLTWGI